MLPTSTYLHTWSTWVNIYEIVTECNILEISGFLDLCRIFPSSGQFNHTFNHNETREERELDPILSSCVENFREFSLVTFLVPPSLSLGDISFALFVMSWGLF